MSFVTGLETQNKKIWKKSKIRPRLDKKEYKKKDWKTWKKKLKKKLKKKVQIEKGNKSPNRKGK